MGKSIFATRLQSAMKSKDKYDIIKGKKKIYSRYTQEKLAKDLGYSINTIKSWTKSDANLPPLDTLKKIASILNVDTAYLLGEQEFKHHKEQTICDATNLSKAAGEILVNMDNENIQMLSLLLENDRFQDMLSNCWGFIHSHYSTSYTISSPTSKDFRFQENQNSKILKYSASDCLSLILEDIYTSREIQAKIDYENELVYDLIQTIQNYIDNHFLYKNREMAINSYEITQEKLKEINPNSEYATISFQDLLKREKVTPTTVPYGNLSIITDTANSPVHDLITNK